LRALFPAGRVPLRDAAALLNTTRRLLAQPVEPAAVTVPYTLEAMGAATLDVYRELIANACTH